MNLINKYFELATLGEPISFEKLKHNSVNVDEDVKYIIENIDKSTYKITKLPNWACECCCVIIDGLEYSHIAFEKGLRGV